MTAPQALAAPNRGVFWLVTVALIAALGLYAPSLCYPVLLQDDFQILAQSWTWHATWAGIWVPQNEHAMPLGRLLTFALDQAAGRPSALPFAAALVGPVALLLGLPLVYRFVGRELGHPLYGLVALVLFGVTSVYQQAVYWFAASFSVLALDTLLLALLAAQEYRRTGRPLYLGLCALGCALSPCWFASGVLAGPLCCLYLLPAEDGAWFPTFGARLRSWLLRATPLLGTGLFLAVSLPLTAHTIMHLEHYKKLDAVAAFQPGKGFWLTCQSLVENIFLGLVGVGGVSVPQLIVGVVLTLAVQAAWRWWRVAPRHRLLLLGIGLIFASYLLVYSARAFLFLPEAGEETPINEPRWSRYHLLPQLGLTLFVCGGLPAWSGRRFELRSDGGLTRRQTRNLAVLIVLCFLVQLPRAVIGANSSFDLPQQMESLRHIEAVDRCCREQRIGAEAARRCLPPLNIPWSIGSVNGWVFLRGSADPVERPDEEVKQLLEKCP